MKRSLLRLAAAASCMSLIVISMSAWGDGFISIKGGDVEIAGELEYEFHDVQKDGNDPNAHFALDKFALEPKIQISDQLKLDAKIYFKEDETTLNEVHAKFSGLPVLDSWIDAGLYERWLKSHHGRKTEVYPLLETAFFRDDTAGITWGAELEPVYWMLSIANGFELNTKQVAEDDAANSKLLHDNHASSGVSDSLEYGINVGVKMEPAEDVMFDIMGFYYTDQLSTADVSRLQSSLSNYTSTDDDKVRYGAGAKLGLAGFDFYGAYVNAEDGALDRDSYFVEASRKIDVDRGSDWFTAVTPLVSYGEYNVDNTATVSLPMTWDREQTILALIFDVYKNTKIKAEYYINDETTGGAETDNDEVLVQLEVKF